MERYDDARCQALAGTLKAYGHERLELEFRLGHLVAGAFVPGVSAGAWEALRQALDASTSFDVVVTDTRELIGDDGGKYVIDMTGQRPPHWMHKKRLWHMDADTDSTWCCRTAAALEVVDPPGRHQPPPGHKFERRKERRSYRYKCWSFDLTKVVGNLPQQLDMEGVTHEVEIELADPAELFARPLPEVLEWGTRLVADVCRIMTLEAPEWT